jgi:hypothetical protein
MPNIYQSQINFSRKLKSHAWKLLTIPKDILIFGTTNDTPALPIIDLDDLDDVYDLCILIDSKHSSADYWYLTVFHDDVEKEIYINKKDVNFIGENDG